MFGLGRQTPSVDDDAVTKLFESEAPGLVAMVRLLMDNPHEAEEVVQEAFTRLLTSRRRLRQIDNAPAYLRSTALNIARSELRKRGSARRNAPKIAVRDDDSSRWSHNVDAANALVARETDDAVITALRTLPDRQRECLVLRYYMSLSEAEIADSLGISRGSVKTHTSRAMGAMQSALKGEQ